MCHAALEPAGQISRNLTDADDGFLNGTRYLIYDRDPLFTGAFAELLKPSGVKTVKLPVRSPDLNPFIERLIGSIRRECLDHVLVINEGHLLRVLREYFAYYHDSRPHQSLDRNAPRPREIEPPSQGRIVAEPQVGGLHHRYRRAA
jgi:transposase InsO family protein